MSKKYNFLYRTINIINGKHYIGIHSTNDLNDGYLGSGKTMLKAIQKYGKSNFNREILSFCGTREEVEELEELVVDEDFVSNNNNYNISTGGSIVYHLISNTHKGKTLSDDTKRKISEARKGKYCGSDNVMFGKTHNSEVRKKISDTHKGKVISEEQRKYYSENYSSGNSPHSKMVRELTTGKIYDCIKDASEDLGIKYSTLRWRLQTNSKTNTLEYV